MTLACCFRRRLWRCRVGPAKAPQSRREVSLELVTSDSAVTDANASSRPGEEPVSALDRAANVLGVEAPVVSSLEAQLHESMPRSNREEGGEGGDHRFSARQLVFGRMVDSARGIEVFLGVTREDVARWYLEGLPAIRREFEALVASTRARSPPDAAALHTAEMACECMEYVLDAEAGSSSRLFANAPHARDCGADGQLLPERKTADGAGKRLADFVSDNESQQAALSELHVAALRIYTTAAFECINQPLRDSGRRERGERHPLPFTTCLLYTSPSPRDS